MYVLMVFFCWEEKKKNRYWKHWRTENNSHNSINDCRFLLSKFLRVCSFFFVLVLVLVFFFFICVNITSETKETVFFLKSIMKIGNLNWNDERNNAHMYNTTTHVKILRECRTQRRNETKNRNEIYEKNDDDNRWRRSIEIRVGLLLCHHCKRFAIIIPLHMALIWMLTKLKTYLWTPNKVWI